MTNSGKDDDRRFWWKFTPLREPTGIALLTGNALVVHGGWWFTIRSIRFKHALLSPWYFLISALLSPHRWDMQTCRALHIFIIIPVSSVWNKLQPDNYLNHPPNSTSRRLSISLHRPLSQNTGSKLSSFSFTTPCDTNKGKARNGVQRGWGARGATDPGHPTWGHLITQLCICLNRNLGVTD